MTRIPGLAFSLVLAAAALLLPRALSAKQLEVPVNTLGPYALGTPWGALQALEGFQEDAKRSDPSKGIQAGRIISLKVFDTPTIQRLLCKDGKLDRVSIVFGDEKITVEKARDLVAATWGDPGPKEKVGDDDIYLWKGTTGVIMILPADGGRCMASLAGTQK